jgi:hypothetical protein
MVPLLVLTVAFFGATVLPPTGARPTVLLPP